MEPFIGEVRLMAIAYVPQGWELCAGQQLYIQQYAALYSIIGNRYGGDGRTNFKLPDLRDQVVLGAGQGPGLRDWQISMTAGQDRVTLQESQMPSHHHVVQGLNNNGTSSSPTADAYLAQDTFQGGKIRYLAQLGNGVTLNTNLNAQSLAVSGASQAHENRQPFLTLNYYIATEGDYPVHS